MKVLADLDRWAKTHKCEGLEEYQSLRQRLLEVLEALPINTENPVRHPMGFVLVANEWWPVNVLNVLERGWAEYRIDYPNGTCESGLARPLSWAHANADNQPSLVLELA